MDAWAPLITAAIAALVAVLGWFVGGYMTSLRDQRNAKRSLVTEHLVRCWRIMANSVHRNFTPEMARQLEALAVDVQLFGSPKQINLMRKVSEEVTSLGPDGGLIPSWDTLLEDLRTELRQELELPTAPDLFTWRITVIPTSSKDDPPGVERH